MIKDTRKVILERSIIWKMSQLVTQVYPIPNFLTTVLS